MALGSVCSILGAEGWLATLLSFLGKPVIALMAGFLSALPLLFTASRQKTDKGSSSKSRQGALHDLTQESLKTAGPIIFITAAGSVLGSVMTEAGFVQFVQNNASILSSVGIFFPFLIAAILKSAMGSSTVAITTTAGMMGLFTDSSSLMAALGMTSPLAAALTVMAIGAGAMTVSHANDSYFWVVTNFGGIKPQDGYRTQTMMTLVCGLASILTIFVISLFVA
jgi:H+/gluconate symporter and related permeases